MKGFCFYKRFLHPVCHSDASTSSAQAVGGIFLKLSVGALSITYKSMVNNSKPNKRINQPSRIHSGMTF